MMKALKNKTIGIIGGMGPNAGLNLFERILSNTKARKDQDHLPVVLLSFPHQIVDRTQFLLKKEPINPAYGILDVIEKMKNTGAEILGIACNTAHAKEIYSVVQQKISTAHPNMQLLHMPQEASLYIKQNFPAVRRVGIMGTNGTFISKTYQLSLEELELEPLDLDLEFQQEVIHKMIYDPEFGIKANPANIHQNVFTLMEKAMQFFKEQKADAIILGCTELSLVLKDDFVNEMHIIDATEVLAKALIREATAQVDC